MTSASESGAAIVEALTARYGAMCSYRDRGVVRRQIEGGQSPIEMPFETAFLAPDRFRFSFDRPHPSPDLRHSVNRFIVGCDGVTSYFHARYYEQPAVLRVEKDVASAVAGATGISSGAAHTIARLLLPKVGGFALRELRELHSLGEVAVDGVVCHRLAGVHALGYRCELLVEKSSLLLRSLWTDLEELRVQEEARWAIRVDEPVDVELFSVPS